MQGRFREYRIIFVIFTGDPDDLTLRHQEVSSLIPKYHLKAIDADKCLETWKGKPSDTMANKTNQSLLVSVLMITSNSFQKMC